MSVQISSFENLGIPERKKEEEAGKNEGADGGQREGERKMVEFQLQGKVNS